MTSYKPQILMICASLSAYKNTQYLADRVKDIYEELGCKVTQVTFDDLTSSFDFSLYDHIDFCMYTWDNGAIPEETECFYDNMDSLLAPYASQITTACLGTGDTFYPNFCMALDTFKEKLETFTTVNGVLKVESRAQKLDLERAKEYAINNKENMERKGAMAFLSIHMQL